MCPKGLFFGATRRAGRLQRTVPRADSATSRRGRPRPERAGPRRSLFQGGDTGASDLVILFASHTGNADTADDLAV